MRKRIVGLAMGLLLCVPCLMQARSHAEAASTLASADVAAASAAASVAVSTVAADPAYSLSVDKISNGQVLLTLSGKDVVDLYGYEAVLSFDPERLELVEFRSEREGFAIPPIVKGNNIVIAHTKVGNIAGDRGNITLGSLKFKFKKRGDTVVKWESLKVVPSHGESVTYTIYRSASNPSNTPGASNHPSASSVSISFSKEFVDLNGHWARADIEWLAARGIIKGVDNVHFKPDAIVSRAQFVTMIARMLNLQPAAAAPFGDVLEGAWYSEAVHSAYAAGVVKGVSNNRFAPEQAMTREEIAVMLVRAGKYAAAAALQDAVATTSALKFADAHTVSSWAIHDVTAAVNAGWIKGRSSNRLMPQSYASRAEAAVMIKRLLMEM